MSKWINVTNAKDIALGQMKRFDVEGNEVLIANVHGNFYAVRDRCGHQKAPLSMGKLDGTHVTCPLHGAAFDLTNGKNISGLNLGTPPGADKLSKEMVDMFARTMEIISKVKIEPLTTYQV